MKISGIQVEMYDTLIQPTEWRYSASIVGLVKYLEYHNFSYKYLNDCDEIPSGVVNGFDGVLYNQSDISEEKYLDFAEYYFQKDMTHKRIEAILNDFENIEEDKREDKIKEVNDLIKSKTVLKNVFKKLKFDGNNSEEILNLINDNRSEIIKSIFRYGKNMYSCYSNTNLMLSEDNPHCRLVGYTVDEGRKSRSLGFCFSKESYEANDIPEFDFIPFAFSNFDLYETFFINNNYSIEMLCETNEYLSKKLSENNSKDSSRLKLLKVLKEGADFINYDVEIVTKSRDDEYYETLFVRLSNLKALQKLGENSLGFSYNISKDYWLNLEQEVYERCLNDVLLDDLILFMLKLYYKKEDKVNKTTVKFRTDTLIDINVNWKYSKGLFGGKTMAEISKDLELAKKLGYVTANKLIELKRKNKIDSYAQKIIGPLVAHDYDRVKEVILSLSSYTDIEYPFFYPFLENAEENKELIMAFASSLKDPTRKNNND